MLDFFILIFIVLIGIIFIVFPLSMFLLMIWVDYRDCHPEKRNKRKHKPP